MYSCTSCNLTFKSKKCLQAHYKTKKHFTGNKESKYKCPCGKSYSYRQGLYSHKQTCTYIPNNSNEEPQISNGSTSEIQTLRTENEELKRMYENSESERKKEIEEMKAQIAMLLDKHAGTTNNNSTNIDTQHIEKQQNIHININAFGNENIDYIDDKSILQCIEKVYKSVPALLEKIHFDPQHPENHNIKITNKKLPYASVMGNNKKWKTMDRKVAIENMVHKGYNILEDKYAENKDKVNTKKQNNFEGFQDRYESQDPELLKNLKNDIDIMVLNG